MNLKTTIPHGKALWWSVSIAAAVLIVAAFAATWPLWGPAAMKVDWRALAGNSSGEPTAEEGGGSSHGGDAHAAHDDGNSIELSAEARKNIHLTTGPVTLGDFQKSVTVPAIIVERPGRSQVQMNAHVTGIIMRIYPIEGEAVSPGQPLFDMRLSHEDIVTAQRDFLQTVALLDVAKTELARLERIRDIIPARQIVEQQYEIQKLQTSRQAQRQALLLHEMTEEQVDRIEKDLQLVQELTVFAPPFADHPNRREGAADDRLYHIQHLFVKQGQQVAAGEPLALLADHSELYVEGQAFEEDAPRLLAAAEQGLPLRVTPVADGVEFESALELSILYVADRVDPKSRALKFYLSLPNALIRSEERGGHRFIAWRYRPGQRMEARIPQGETWTDQIVLPTVAVVQEGAEAFVFEQNGDHFDRVPVHVIYRGRDKVVVENDGRLIAATLAMSGAYELHLAIKNQSGGGADPHAGHTH